MRQLRSCVAATGARRAVSPGALFFASLASAALGGCGKHATHKAPPVSASPSPPSDVPTESTDVKHGTRKLMGLDVPVYVDGEQRGVLRHGDLPALAETKAWNGAPGYRLSEYLTALGVPLGGIRTIHLYANGNRIGGVEGKELLADKNRFVFGFLSGNTGAPMTRWSVTGLKNRFMAHEIRRVAVYVTQPPPMLDPERSCIVRDGACSDEIPFATSEVAKGTRIYIDGKMAGFVKRRLLGDNVVVGKAESGDVTYSVAKLVASYGCDPATIRAVDLVAGDDVVGHADQKAWERHRDMTFTLVKHEHGKVHVQVPAELQAQPASETKDALVASIQVFTKTRAPVREIVSISPDTDESVRLASAAPAAMGEAHARVE